MEKGVLSSGSGKVKETWEISGKNLRFDKEYPCNYGYPWPPRSYTCSFCQREFKSAQALGGHMNIHRRDRARLRDIQSADHDHPNNNNPSLLVTNSNDHLDQHPNPNPNPNPNHPNPIDNFSPSSSPTNNNIYAHQYSLVSLSLSSLPPSIKNGENKLNMGLGRFKDFLTIENNPQHEVLKAATHSTKEVVKLDLELCLGETKQELDLELRLGI